ISASRSGLPSNSFRYFRGLGDRAPFSFFSHYIKHPPLSQLAFHSHILRGITFRNSKPHVTQGPIDLFRSLPSLPDLRVRPLPDAIDQPEHRNPAMRQLRAEIETAARDHEHVVVAHHDEVLGPVGPVGGLQQNVERKRSTGLERTRDAAKSLSQFV